jgi:uncharacterized protein YceK
MPRPLAIAVLALSTAICGCGTMTNMHSATGNIPPRPFGGLATDFDAIGEGDLLGLVDLPGSLVGDVVTLPDVLLTNARHDRMNAPLDSTDPVEPEPRHAPIRDREEAAGLKP